MTEPFVEDPDDPWLWWRTANEHPDWIGTPMLPIHEGHPQMGLFRVRGRDGQWQHVHIWKDPFEVWQAMRGGASVDPAKVNDLWIWACRTPVTEDAYDRANRGDGWEDEPPKAPGIGHNINEADPRDALAIEYAGEKETAEELLKAPIRTQAEADRAAILARDRLPDIAHRAEAQHKIDAAPSVEEKRRIDNHWRDLREQPVLLAQRLKRHMQAFFDEQDRIERERVAAARREADRLRREAEEAEREAQRKARDAERASTPQEVIDVGRKIAAAKEAELQTAYVGPRAGRTGATVAMKTFISAKVVDWDKLHDAIRDRDDVRKLAQSIADANAKVGTALPGCEIVKERRAV
jgi:hypothetical protein